MFVLNNMSAYSFPGTCSYLITCSCTAPAHCAPRLFEAHIVALPSSIVSVGICSLVPHLRPFGLLVIWACCWFCICFLCLNYLQVQKLMEELVPFEKYEIHESAHIEHRSFYVCGSTREQSISVILSGVKLVFHCVPDSSPWRWRVTPSIKTWRFVLSCPVGGYVSDRYLPPCRSHWPSAGVWCRWRVPSHQSTPV